MLTKAMLEVMPPNTIFATGEIVDNPEGINMTNSGKILRWIAKRGWIYGWTILVREGDKVTGEHNIRKLVPCDDEAWKLYRL